VFLLTRFRAPETGTLAIMDVARYRHRPLVAGLLRPWAFAIAAMAWGGSSQFAWAQETAPSASKPSATSAGLKTTSEVRDEAKLFGEEAVSRAESRLAEIERESGVSVAIETIASLGDGSFQDVLDRLSRRLEQHQILVLIFKKEARIEVLPSRDYRRELSASKVESIRSGFIGKFRERDFDAGLGRGIEAIAAAVSPTARTGEPAPPNERGREKSAIGSGIPPLAPAREAEKTRAEAAGGSDRDRTANAGVGRTLVVRNQVHLALGGARIILDEARQYAESHNLKSNIAVVDDGGHLIAFERMDGARPASGYTAITKATTAATFRQPTGPLPAGSSSPDPLLNLSLQNAAAASGGKITTLFGGVPIVVDGQIIGAVGVGGGTGEQDAAVARAGIDALLKALSSQNKQD
jgi:glc operon protein GlcG